MRLAQVVAGLIDEAQLAPLNHNHPKIERDIAQVIDILQGPEQAGGVRSGGLVAEFQEMKRAIDGGVSLSRTEKAALAVAAIGGLSTIIAAVVGSLN